MLVTVELPGASAFEVEQQVVVPIEHAISSAPGIAEIEIESVATVGRARLYVSFASGTDPYTAMTGLRDAMPQDSLPIEAGYPVLERADRDASLMFVRLDPDGAGDAVGPGEHEAMEVLGDAVGQQPGVWKVMRCGWARQVLVAEIDPVKLVALGLTLEPIIEYIGAKVPAGLGDAGIDDMMAALAAPLPAPIGGMVRLSDVASVRVESREGSCAVLGAMGRAHPTLQIWGTPAGIANAKTIVQDAAIVARVRTSASICACARGS